MNDRIEPTRDRVRRPKRDHAQPPEVYGNMVADAVRKMVSSHDNAVSGIVVTLRDDGHGIYAKATGKVSASVFKTDDIEY